MLTTVIALGAAGVLLLFLEMFLPGMIAGIIGGILLFAAVVMAYSEIGIEAGNIALLAATATTACLWWWWAAKFQHTRFGRSMTLSTTGTGTAQAEGLAQWIGQTGTAVTPLRPSGTILIEGKRVDAITSGEFLEQGTPVQIIRAEGSGVIVRLHSQPDSPFVPRQIP